MISPKKLIKMARKWQKVAASWGKRISVPRIDQGLNADCCSTSSVADKGHFVVYTADRKRFMIPLAYLNTQIFRDLLKMSEEEFGLPSDGPITLLCDSFFMEYIVFLIQRSVAKDLEKALLMSFANTRSSPSFFSHQEQMKPRFLVCSYWIKDSSILQMINSFTSYKNPRALLHISLSQHWKWSNLLVENCLISFLVLVLFVEPIILSFIRNFQKSFISQFKSVANFTLLPQNGFHLTIKGMKYWKKYFLILQKHQTPVSADYRLRHSTN